MPGKRHSSHPLNYEALADFRHEIRLFLNFSEQAARAAGLEPQQHQALLALKGLPRAMRATIRALAERLQIEPHSAVELVNRLERRGLMRRRRGTADRREVLVRLTARGERLLRRLSEPHHAELQSAGPRLLGALAVAMEHAGDAERRGGGAQESVVL